MDKKVLVTYATRYGSTQEVAEKVAEKLRAGGLTVDVQPAGKVRSLEGYGAVVLGAALYINHWLKDAQKFLNTYQASLEKLPVAVFSIGPTTPKPEEWVEPRRQHEQELAAYTWLKPVAAELFGGVYDPDKLRFPDSLIKKMPASPLKDMPKSDVRNWEDIFAWADALAIKLG